MHEIHKRNLHGKKNPVKYEQSRSFLCVCNAAYVGLQPAFAQDSRCGLEANGRKRAHGPLCSEPEGGGQQPFTCWRMWEELRDDARH